VETRLCGSQLSLWYLPWCLDPSKHSWGYLLSDGMKYGTLDSSQMENRGGGGEKGVGASLEGETGGS
jgi:hypothetical protein